MSTTASDVPESGQLPGRLEYAPEPSRGEVPTDPDFQYASDVMRSFEAESGASLGRQDSLGTPDAVDHNRAMEEPSCSLGYDLQQFPVTINFDDPEDTTVGATSLGVASDQSGDTDIDVTIYNDDESTSETITTDGSDGTTFVTGSTQFSTIGRVEVSSDPSGTITVSEDNSGSAGTAFGSLASSDVDVASGDDSLEDLTPTDPSGYGVLRDQYNRLPGTLMWVYRREYPGGNDNAGVREYTVVRGAAVSSATPTLDPSGENPILMELDHQPVKVRSYKIHQLSSAETLTVSSTESSADSGLSVTVESEDAGKSETISMGSTGATSFDDIDAVWLDGLPEGDITVEGNSSGTVVIESTSTGGAGALAGGLTYSDDDQPVDGDRGVPTLGSGSHASAIGTSYEHFVGDRFERPSGTAVRPRVNSGSWTVENDISTSALHDTRAPAVDEGNRTVTVDADVAGEYVSHDSMMEALQKEQHNLEHELSGGIVVFKNTVPTGVATRTAETDQAAASTSETLSASGQPAIDFRSA